MLEYPHSSVVRALKRFNPLLTVAKNQNWREGMDPFERWWVSQDIMAMHPTNDESTVIVTKSNWQVLGVNQASEIDERWFHVLDAHRWKNIKDPATKLREDEIAAKLEAGSSTREWIKEVGHHYWKKQYGQFRFPNAKRVDPTYARKKREDKLGRIPL